MDNYSRYFKKMLGYWDSVAIIIAIVIGVGIFRVPAEVAKYLISPYLIILAWLSGGIISLLGGLCYAELSSSFPKTGGNYIYLRESYGKWAGFLFGWTELLVIRTGSIASVAFVCAEYLRSFLSLDQSLIKPLAIFIIAALSFINIFGLRYGKRVLDAFTMAKVFAIIGIIVFGAMSKTGSVANFYSVPAAFNKETFQLFGLALIPILWTYGGWHENTFVAGETHDAKKTIPLALFTGIFIVICLYLAINALYIYLIPAGEIAKSNLIASDVLQILYGRWGKKMLEALIVISSLGCIDAMIITGSRVTFAMAEDNVIFNYIVKVNTRYGTLDRAIIINSVWAIALIALGTFNKLLFFTGIAVWLFFALAVSGLFVLRHKFPDMQRPYSAWGYPLIPAIFIIICIGLAVNTIIYYRVESFIGLSLVMSGIPVYALSKNMKQRAS